MKKVDTLLKDYTTRLTTDSLKFLYERLSVRASGDLAECLDFMSNNNDIDKWLKNSSSANDFYDMIDLVEKFVEKEYRKRIPDLVVA